MRSFNIIYPLKYEHFTHIFTIISRCEYCFFINFDASFFPCTLRMRTCATPHEPPSCQPSWGPQRGTFLSHFLIFLGQMDILKRRTIVLSSILFWSMVHFKDKSEFTVKCVTTLYISDNYYALKPYPKSLFRTTTQEKLMIDSFFLLFDHLFWECL